MSTNSSHAKRVSDDTSDYLIERLVEEITDAVNPDGRDESPELTTLEDRLTQLRESPEDAVTPPDPSTPTGPVETPAAPHLPAPQHVAPVDRGKRRAPSRGERGGAGADAVILEAIASTGADPIYLNDGGGVGRQQRARRHKRRGSLSFYLMALLLLGFSYVLFVLYKPTLEKLVVPLPDHPASAAAIMPCAVGVSPQGRSDLTNIAGLCAAATAAPVLAKADSPLVTAQNIAAPELPAIYRNERLVKTYRVGADGKIAFVPDAEK